MEQTYLSGNIRERIREQLALKDMKQAQLARIVGIGESTFSRFLSGETAKLDHEYVIRIAREFKVSTDFLLGINALRIDWETVVPKDKLNYIMGNPPFVGQYLRVKSQTEDINLIFGKGSIETKLDYVICWYKKALDLLNKAGKGKISVP